MTIEGTALTPGLYTAGQPIAQFPNNFDPTSTGTLTVIPEPASMALAGCGLVLVAGARIRRKAT